MVIDLTSRKIIRPSQNCIVAALAAAGRSSFKGGSISPFWVAVYMKHWPIPQPNQNAAAWPALNYQNYIPPLRAGCRALFGAELHTSVSRLEQFAQCPLPILPAWLRLQEREDYSVDAPDMGILSYSPQPVCETVAGRKSGLVHLKY